MKKRKLFNFSATQLIMLGFAFTVLTGSILLYLPFSSADSSGVSYIDALFTATTATCVTGLVTLPTVTTWSTFGQIVILLLIQIGGLGVITIMSGFMLVFKKRMGLSDRLIIQDSFNLNTMSGLVKFVKKVLYGTFIVEAVGALLYMTVFVPEFGVKGIWISVFNSVSAFCNAGIDILSENSLCDYSVNPVVNSVTSALIILGGIGYVVWLDVLQNLRKFPTLRLRCFRRLSLHSKLAVCTTAFLLVSGAVAFFVFEYNNPLTIGELSLFDKIQVSVFQSVTTRTAGFATVAQENITDASAVVSLLLMFIGGSPVGTAGGVKTVTVAILILAAVSTIKKRNEVYAFNRNISQKAIIKAIAVVSMSFFILFASTVLLSAVSDADALDIIYETVSATATVGLTRNLTSSLNLWGKLIIIFTMYLGRVGPISLAVAFNFNRKNQNKIKNPTEEISVG